jgi:succinate dehydrogenase / fumarate reductase cytochrome b subunit
MRYRWDTGFWAWLLMRVSGVLIVLYLILHLFVLSRLGVGKEAFEALVGLMDNPVTKLLELGLVGCILYHGLNGIRICILDLGWGLFEQKRLFWATMAVGAVIFAVAAVPVLMHV